MQYMYVFYCLDHSLRDIIKLISPERGHVPFGDVTVLLGGDFRQLILITKHGYKG